MPQMQLLLPGASGWAKIRVHLTFCSFRVSLEFLSSLDYLRLRLVRLYGIDVFNNEQSSLLVLRLD
jgi:hypothetical protein